MMHLVVAERVDGLPAEKSRMLVCWLCRRAVWLPLELWGHFIEGAELVCLEDVPGLLETAENYHLLITDQMETELDHRGILERYAPEIAVHRRSPV